MQQYRKKEWYFKELSFRCQIFLKDKLQNKMVAHSSASESNQLATEFTVSNP